MVRSAVWCLDTRSTVATPSNDRVRAHAPQTPSIRCTLSDALVSPDLGGPRFLVLPGQRAPHHQSEVLVSKELKGLISRLKSQSPSTIVIFDMPPMLATDAVMAVLPQADAILVVVAVGASTMAEIDECEQQLESANLLGIILNKSNEAHHSFY